MASDRHPDHNTPAHGEGSPADGREPLARGISEGCDGTDTASIAALEATGRYRILRRVPALPPCAPGALGTDEAVGIVLDLETTGLDPEWDEPVEIAMVRFRYGIGDGCIRGLDAVFSSLAEPSIPVPAAVTRLTGLSPADLRGQAIDSAEVAAFVEPANLVVAHNARFDRVFAEAFWPVFATRPWACSCTGVDWAARGFDGARLDHLLLQAGFYHRGHRALDDVTATLHLLGLKRPGDASSAFAEMLVAAREPTVRIWAEGAPFCRKDELRRRGYRWSDGRNGAPRAWFRDVPVSSGTAESAYLRREVYEAGSGPRIALVTAHERYSARAGTAPPRSAALRALLAGAGGSAA